MVPARSLQGLSLLGIMKRNGLYFLGAERKGALVPGVILDRFWGGVVALGAANIYLTDPQKKVQGGIGLSRNRFLDGLVLVVFWRPFCLAWVRMEGLRPLCNRQIKTGSEIITLASNFWKTVYNCSKWAAQSITSSNWCWKSFLIVFQMMSTKALDSPRFWQKKALNPSQPIGILVWSFILCWYCCHWNQAVFFKKVAANKTRFGPVASVVAKWSLHFSKKL